MTKTQQAVLSDQLHHVAIQVEDIARAVYWYQEKFQVEVIYQDDSWAMLRFKNIDLALVMPGQHPPHIAIESQTAEQFGELALHRDGTRSIYINDPEGNVLEVMQAGCKN